MIKFEISPDNPDSKILCQAEAKEKSTKKELLKQARAITDQLGKEEMEGWYRLIDDHDQDEIAKIKAMAEEIEREAKFLVCIGIGGSYLGHRAMIEALGAKSATKILYIGQNLDPRTIREVIEEIGKADFAVNVISKSGTTTEPAIGFRIFKQKLKARYGNDYYKRVYVTTDSAKGALFTEAVEKNYQRLVVPDDIGGRYSVLSAVGLLPMMVAGVKIDELIAGATAEKQCRMESAIQYAVARQQLLKMGKLVEVMAVSDPHLQLLTEWWKQLFGESEGKHRQGIFPASVTYTTDLHSLGQYLQDGDRRIFETVIKIASSTAEDEILVPEDSENLDGLNYLAGRSVAEINRVATEATIVAHREGGINVLEIELIELNERSLGALIFFFEVACAVSSKLKNINPYDQPGVEAYKKEMFRRLGKPE